MLYSAFSKLFNINSAKLIYVSSSIFLSRIFPSKEELIYFNSISFLYFKIDSYCLGDNIKSSFFTKDRGYLI